jgi:hypothetical protein
MKRRRSWVETPRRSRRLQVLVFPFLDLLPEMRGEVKARVDDRSTHVALARTCKQLLSEFKPPVFPVAWQRQWAKLKKKATHHFFHSACRAVFHLMDMGLTRLPGMFHHGALHFQTCRPPSSGSVVWQWFFNTNPHRSQWLLQYRINDETFIVISQPLYHSRGVIGPIDSLAKVDVEIMERWCRFIALPERRRPPDMYRLMRPREFDEDTPV